MAPAGRPVACARADLPSIARPIAGPDNSRGAALSVAFRVARRTEPPPKIFRCAKFAM